MTLNSGVTSNHCHFFLKPSLLLAQLFQHHAPLSLLHLPLLYCTFSWPHDAFPSRARGAFMKKRGEKMQQSGTLEYSHPALISLLKMTEEKDHTWRKSLYNGLGEKKGRKKRWREPTQSLHPLVQELNPQRKLLINIQFVQGCSKCVQLLIYCTSGAYPVQRSGSMSTNQKSWKQVCFLCHGCNNFQPLWHASQFNSIQINYTLNEVNINLIWFGFNQRHDLFV